MRFALEQIYIGALRGLGVVLVFVTYYILDRVLVLFALLEAMNDSVAYR